MSTEKERNVKNQLVWDNRVVASDIEVEVKDSVAILSGTVSSYYEKIVAGDDALSVPGIRSVENNLRVAFPEEFTVLTDREIRDSINTILMWDTRIDSRNIHVGVDSGIVTLEGSVDAYWKVYEAEDIAFRVSGVMDVINNLKVIWGQSYEDAIIEDEIRNAIERSKVISDDLSVEVSNGVVTLRGTVTSPGQKIIARDKALFTGGVTDVINEIEVI